MKAALFEKPRLCPQIGPESWSVETEWWGLGSRKGFPFLKNPQTPHEIRTAQKPSLQRR